MRWFVLGAVVLLVAAPLEARPPHKRTLEKYYGTLLAKSLNSCTTCHLSKEQAGDPNFDAESPPHNAFGLRLAALGEDLEIDGKPNELVPRLRQIAGEDTDGDGVANELELLSGHFPGDKTDVTPGDKIAAAETARSEFLAKASLEVDWSPFKPVARPAVPQLANKSWARNEIDHFIAAEHAKRHVTPQPEAARHVLLRRVYLDLIGLPPTRAELQAFLADDSPDAFDEVVDRLLESPHYGERWGRHWMDVWRYSDWAGWGTQVRDSQPHIWRWRDWIIESVNADKPYDQMLREMLAGDELKPGDPSTLRATGYLVRNYKRLSREQWMQETVEHTAKAFLGLTVACARCHDHMYDPISQREYYEFRAVFEPYGVRLDRVPGEFNTEKDGLPRIYDADIKAATYLFERGDERRFDKDQPLVPAVLSSLGQSKLAVQPVQLPATEYYPGLQPLVQELLLKQAEAAIAAAKTALNKARETAGEQTTPDVTLAEKFLAVAEASRADLQARIAADRAKYAEPPAVDAADLATAANQSERQTALAKAEENAAKVAVKLAGLRQALKPADPEKPADDAAKKAAETAQKNIEAAEKELATAETIIKTAREAVDKPAATYAAITPVYPTTSSGRRSAFANWIADAKNPLTARVAVNHIWLRHFGRGLVETVFDFGQNGTNPSHPLLLDWLASELVARNWSMKALHRQMVTSSTYRMASTADEASLKTDPDNRWLWRHPERRMEAELVRDSVLYVSGQLDKTLGGPTIPHDQGHAVKRRSLYFQHAAEKQMAFLKLFDVAAVNECYQRKESIVPQQALALVNSSLTLAQSRLLARSLNKQFGPDDEQFVTAAFEQILTRTPKPAELDACRGFLASQVELLNTNKSRLTVIAASDADATRPAADPALRARENLVHALLNHNDFVTVR